MTNWTKAAEAVYEETKTALQTVYDALNQGQRQKLLKDETVAALLKFYGVTL